MFILIFTNNYCPSYQSPKRSLVVSYFPNVLNFPRYEKEKNKHISHFRDRIFGFGLTNDPQAALTTLKLFNDSVRTHPYTV